MNAKQNQFLEGCTKGDLNLVQQLSVSVDQQTIDVNFFFHYFVISQNKQT